MKEENSIMEKLFKLKENGTNVKTEIVAGLSTFMTMAYIVALNPSILVGDNGQNLWNAVFLATVISAAIGTFMMAILANKPFAMAPGMGLNNFFAYIVAHIATTASVTYLESFQAALSIVFIEGIVFIVLSVFKVREKIVKAIPIGVRMGIAPAIGIMLLNIGLGSNAILFEKNGNPIYMLSGFFANLTPSRTAELMGGHEYKRMVLYVVTTFVGLFIIMALAHKKFTGAVLVGMLAASCIYFGGQALFLGENPFAGLENASWMPPFKDMADLTLFKFDFKGLLEIGWLSATLMVITFCMIDMFDTIGTLVGTASRAGMVDKEGNMPKMKEALLSDAIGTAVGACTGTSTVTTFVESAAGVEAGGRTGLTAVTTAILFAACMFIAPIAAIIPAPATSAALVYVGIVMLSGLKNIDFDDMTQMAPVALMLIAMPITSSIGHGIGLGLISYTFIMVLTGKAKKVSLLTYILSAMFIVKFFLVV